MEPEGRNTAPALALAAIQICKTNPETLMHVMPSDHIILDDKYFVSATEAAGEYAKKGMLMTFGIKPISPETGYGYIRKGREYIVKNGDILNFRFNT